MPSRTSLSGGELFIVDNSDVDWKVVRYLHDWSQIAKGLDIATGYFEIGSLLAMNDEWQKIDQIRILMGDEVSKRTKAAFEAGLQNIRCRLNESLETAKEKNDFLVGVPKIVEAIRSGKIQCRVYRKEKFHAKAYITHGRLEVVGPAALVGSSNFTYPGITENIELNVQITGRPVTVLQEWYEQHWQNAEDVSPEILRTIERHIREYSPFEVYAKALHEFFRSHAMTVSEWESTKSLIYPVLNQYQRYGYQMLMKIAQQFGGAFLCDGVGLGKTFIGLMLIERLIMHERKRVALFVPKAAREDVWESHLRRYLPDIWGDFSSLVIFNHTDLGRGGDFPRRFERVAEMADVIVVDEAHHFRNPGIWGSEDGEARLGPGVRRPSRYRMFFDLIGKGESKQVFLLTATPINNKLDDFRHMAELFTRRQDDYFKTRLGIHSLGGHFVKMERELKSSLYPDLDPQIPLPMELFEAEQMLTSDTIFKALVVQRSRAYVRQSQEQEGSAAAIFPTREPPKVVDYSVKKSYGKLLDSVERAFAKDKPLFILSIYYPLAYYKTSDVDVFVENRQKQVVGLIRTQFLKRFESSAQAFELSCARLLLKLLAWVQRHSETELERRRLTIWKEKHSDLVGFVQQQELHYWGSDVEVDADEDIITDEMLEAVEHLPRDQYRVEDILADTYEDLNQVAEFLRELSKFEPKHDDKLKGLIRLLTTNEQLKGHRVLIFSEFAETARYLKKELEKAGIDGVEEVDSASKDRRQIIRRFAPYYNESSSSKLAEKGISEIRILISTDVLSEGLNLQDATRLINYDLHWNPVRLMQRIGRVDRRMNPAIEFAILKDHPEQKKIRGKVLYWNFLPPEDLETLLSLYTRVSHKTLRISKTFGIEGKKLFKPEDDFDALKDFNHSYNGTVTSAEKMQLEYQQLLKDHPELADRLDTFPGKVFSGKRHPHDKRAVFFCYALPAPSLSAANEDAAAEWSTDAGQSSWYLYDIQSNQITEEPSEMIELIRSLPDTPRHTSMPQKSLAEIRSQIEKHIKNTYLKQMQAPLGVKPVLKCWMELS